MGSNEMDKSSKDTKEAKETKTPTPQEQSSPVPTGTVNPDWPGFQAYSPVPPHGYIASNPQAHPYMWGVQHHLMPPYGTPPHPYVTMYPHGGMYAHPSMPPGSYPFSPFPMPSPNGIVEPSANTHGNTEVENNNNNNNNNKPSEVKEKLPIKRSKGSLGSLNMIMGKDNEVGKTSGASANGAYSKSGAESGSENSSDGSDANSHNESQMNSGGRQDSAQSSQNGSGAHVSQNGGGPSMAVVPIPGSNVVGPATNLNIGMDYWTAGTPAIPAIHGKVASSTPVQGTAINARDNFQPQLWDERELKRQKRKQSNRESARRSRLRKQAECDELGQRAELLTEENVSLKAELSRLRNEQDQLLAENVSLKEKLAEATGQEIKDMGQEENNAQSG